jgi:two-component system, OmpR family, sensor histidine kinase VicK
MSFVNANSERTEIFTGEETTTRLVLQVLSDSRHKCQSCTDSTSPSVSIGVFKKAIEDAKSRGINFKFLTEITTNNLSYCKLLSIGSELRHLDGIKGNFSIFDDKVYLASAILKESQPVSQLIYSNVKTFVEQQQYLFETLWNRAIPAEIRIREIEEDTILGVTEVIQDPSKIQALFINLTKSAKKEVFLVLPTINAFYREERLGIIRLLQEAALDRNINVRILAPTNDIVEKKVRSISAIAQGQKFGFRSIETASGATVTTVTIVVVDRKESLAIEKIDDSKDNFLEATGSATYSNSKPTVLSYLSIFESLWQQTELYMHVKEVNKQLEYANEQLLATERAKEEFISMISHELKTPLVPLKGYAQMLLRPKIMGAEVNERQKNAIDAMNRNIEKLQALVDDVMDVYKLDMGKLRFSMTDTDITKLINETISELRSLTLAKKIDLNVHIKANGTVFCDPNRIEQVLSNLIKNSIDFVPNIDGKITLRVQKDDNDINNDFKMALFTVEDNGIGINPEKADKLFQKFYQIDTGPTRKHAGTGLGLVICRGIIEAHGGKIWLDNTHRLGAAIKFTLPVSGQEDKEERDTGT